jgi:hypothetical protein
MWQAIVRKILSWVITNADFKLYTSGTPTGHPLGGHDDPNLPDKYIILGIWYKEKPLLVGYFQKT